MSSSRLRKTLRRWAPRLVSLLVLSGILCSIIPLPVGQSTAKDLSQPFPCQHRACGCRSAAQCWKKCCCFTNSQKLAWAKANQVQPPEHVVAAAQRESGDAVCDSNGCCLRHSTTQGEGLTRRREGAKEEMQDLFVFAPSRLRVRHLSPEGLKSPDSSDAPEFASATVDQADQTNPPATTLYVVGVLAQQCQGEGWFWNSLPWTVLPSLPEPMHLRRPAIPRQEIAPDDLRVVSHRPPVPPPRGLPVTSQSI